MGNLTRRTWQVRPPNQQKREDRKYTLQRPTARPAAEVARR